MRYIAIIFLFFSLTGVGQTISKWSLDGDVTDKIAAANGVNHNVTFSDGKSGLAGYFNGTNGYVAVDPALFNFGTTTWTMTFMVKCSTLAANGRLIVKGVGATPNFTGWYLGISSGTQGLFIFNYGTGGTCLQHFAKGKVNDEKWHHIAVIITQDLSNYANNIAHTYIDGINRDSVNNVAVRNPLQNTDSLRIGASKGAAITVTAPVYLDNVQIYSRALTPAEIKNDYLKYFAP